MDPEVAVYEALGKELLRRCMADESAIDLHQWLSEQLARLGGGTDDGALLTWDESFGYTRTMLARFEELAAIPPGQRRVFDWPWSSWNGMIDTLEAGMLAVVTAPDGEGKTLYAECIAEHWARHHHQVVFVHFELNPTLMMLRRLGRHAPVLTRQIKEGLSPEQRSQVDAVEPRLRQWPGAISYLHAPGWTMERAAAELRRLHAEGLCDVAIIDYLEKAHASRRQLQVFGSNHWQREADNVELLKTFAESAEIPVLMVAQMNKAGKGMELKDVSRIDMRGAGEKSEKANLVIMLRRGKDTDGRPSNDVTVLVDKQTQGPTGSFRQRMQPEYYRVADIAKEAT